jgi:hypothetical protein
VTGLPPIHPRLKQVQDLYRFGYKVPGACEALTGAVSALVRVKASCVSDRVATHFPGPKQVQDLYKFGCGVPGASEALV